MSKNKGQLLSWLDILYKKYACYLTKLQWLSRFYNLIYFQVESMAAYVRE